MSLWSRLGMWFCGVGWHPSKGRDYGFSFSKVRCGRCGFIGLEDSQGNLF